MAFSLVEPFGPTREDERSGVVAAIIANANRDPKKRQEPFEPHEFLSRYSPDETVEEPEKGPDADKLNTKLQAWAAAMQAAHAAGERPKSQLRERRG